MEGKEDGVGHEVPINKANDNVGFTGDDEVYEQIRESQMMSRDNLDQQDDDYTDIE